MKTATKNLEDDHVHILLLIDVMERIARSGKPVMAHLEKVVDIIKNFADGLHHAKENNILFRMADNVMSESDHIYLLASFDEAEKNHASSEGKLDYPSQIKELANYYKISNK